MHSPGYPLAERPENERGDARARTMCERRELESGRRAPASPRFFSRLVRERFSVDRVRERNCARPLSRDPEGGRNDTPETHCRDRGNDRGSGHAGRRGDRRRVRPERRRRAAARARQARQGHREEGRRPGAADDAAGEADAASARRGLAGHGRPGQGRARRGLQPDRPGEDQPPPARRGGAVAAAHPDPVRLRHDPRLPHGVPDPARQRRAASTRRSPPPTTRSPLARRRRSGSSRSTARWSTSRTSPAGAGSPRARARTRTSARCSRPRGSRPRRATTTPRSTRSSQAPSTSPRTASPRAGASTTRRTCPSSGCWNMYLPPFKAAIDAGADTVMCSFNAISGVPGCANHETETDILKQEWHFDGFIESDYTAVDELIRHGSRGQRRRRGGGGAERGHRLRDGEHEHPRQRRAAARRPPDLDGPDRRRGASGSCASSSARGCSTIRTSTRPRPRTRAAS